MASTQFEIWLEKTNEDLRKEFEKLGGLKWNNLTYQKGRKFIKITHKLRVWGFVSMYEGLHDNCQVYVGDLLKAANYSRPAKHSRGNIFNGTAKFTWLGPDYLT